jgi:hypothetical protein
VGREGLLDRDSESDEDRSGAQGRAPRREAEAGRSAHQARLFDGRADDAGEARRSRQAASPSSAPDAVSEQGEPATRAASCAGGAITPRAAAQWWPDDRRSAARRVREQPRRSARHLFSRTPTRSCSDSTSSAPRRRGLITPGLSRDGTPAISRKLRVNPGRSPGVELEEIPANKPNSGLASAWIAPRRSPVRVRLAPSRSPASLLGLRLSCARRRLRISSRGRNIRSAHDLSARCMAIANCLRWCRFRGFRRCGGRFTGFRFA